MINFEALFKLTYGLYIVASGDKNTGNAYVSNTVFQVTSEPAKFATCCNKDNFTSDIIDQSGAFSVSVIEKDADKKLFSKFGYRSGKDFNKFEGASIRMGETGVPVVLDHCIAYLECKLVDKIDVGTHWMFIGELVVAEVLDENAAPISYDYYRETKKLVAPKNAPTYMDKSKINKKETPSREKKKYKCAVCGYEYDENEESTPFPELPEDWQCPVCGAGKEDFIQQ